MTEMINYIIKCTIEVLKNNVSLTDLSMMDDKNIEYVLTKEINQKLVGDVNINMDGTNKELFVLDEVSDQALTAVTCNNCPLAYSERIKRVQNAAMKQLVFGSCGLLNTTWTLTYEDESTLSREKSK